MRILFRKVLPKLVLVKCPWQEEKFSDSEVDFPCPIFSTRWMHIIDLTYLRMSDYLLLAVHHEGRLQLQLPLPVAQLSGFEYG
jgi:hypothetical protein